MSMTKDCTATKPPSTTVRSSCFLGCFGCSGKSTQPNVKVNSGSRRRWIPKWNFSFKKSATKTVPVDLTTNSRKSNSKKHPPVTSNTTWEIQVVEEDTRLTKKSLITVEAKHTPTTSDEKNTRRKKRTDVLKQQSGSYRSRRNETKAAAATAVVSSPVKPLTHSTSPPKEKKPLQAPVPGGGADKGAFDKPIGFDSVIGMSVILVILVIMVLWGKICAILCTSAWFFIAPRVLTGGERSALPTAEKGRRDLDNDLDLESMEYKKKVVLEGLLQRNNRNIVGRL